MIRSPLVGLAGLLLAAGAAPQPPWSPAELATLRTLWIGSLAKPPPELSNGYADRPAAATLGQSLFFDTGFSANGRVSCSSCHEPHSSFTDGHAVGKGLATGSRRTMPIAPAVHSAWQFWDGRADSLWSQALGPVENPVEQGFTRTEVVRRLAARYRGPYEAVFGPLPYLSDTSRFPVRASPTGGTEARTAWARIADPDKMMVNRAFANFGKSIAAFERTLQLRPTRFDAYVADALGTSARPGNFTPEEEAGLRLFIGKGSCLQCHNGPLLTSGDFANTGVPRRLKSVDDGRATGARQARADPFNCTGKFSDAPAGGCEETRYAVVGSPADIGAFKVPSLRGVGRRAPYMHAGQFATLQAVVDHYSRAPAAALGRSRIIPLHLSTLEQRQLVAFLRTLDEPPTGLRR